MAKIPRDVSDECRATAERKARTLTYEELSVLPLELALEKESDQHLNAYRLGGGNTGNHGRGYQGPRPGQGTTSKNARYMSNVQDLLWCHTGDEQGRLLRALDCAQHQCFVVQGRKQDTNSCGKAKMPDHYKCTITCALCGKRKHYKDECYHMQRLFAKLKSEAQNGGGGRGGRSNGKNGKGKSQGQGKGKGPEQGKGGGRAGPDQKNQDNNQDRSGGNPTPTPGGTNAEASGGQQNPGRTASSQAQAQQEQGAKRGNEDGYECKPRNCSRFMRMARKLRKKGLM